MAVEVTILGSGTLRPDARRHSASHLVRHGSSCILMDCGSGALHGMARWAAPWDGLTHVLITHFHTDHVGDLAPLLFALSHGVDPPRTAPLVVLGPPGIREFMRALADAHGSFMRDPGFPLEIVELAREGFWSDADDRFTVSSHPTRHTDHSVAYRVETPAGTVAYTGDTGPEPGLGEFMAGVELLISECSHPDPPIVDTHLTPEGLARLAEQAQPDLLLVTHIFPELDARALPDLVSKAGYSGRVRLAEDGMAVLVNGGVARCL